jgi:hypothetical protein
MVSIKSPIDLCGINDRAADIRARWSPAEKSRRLGLPPDLPAHLRRFFIGQYGVLQLVASTPFRPTHMPSDSYRVSRQR